MMDTALTYEAIRDLLARYCEKVDEYDVEGVASCFAPDASTDYGPGRGGLVHGRDAIAARIGKGQAEFRRTHHQLGQIRISLKGDSADTTSYMLTWHERWNGQRETVALRYLDNLARQDGTWFICHRRVEVAIVDGFEGTEWAWVKRRQPADNPYSAH